MIEWLVRRSDRSIKMSDRPDEPKPFTLNLLLQTCVDGEEGYLLASESVKDAELKETFGRYAAQRARFRELRLRIRWRTIPLLPARLVKQKPSYSVSRRIRDQRIRQISCCYAR